MRWIKNGIGSQALRGVELLALVFFMLFGAGMALYWAARLAIVGQS